MKTLQDFFQSPPSLANQYETDSVLISWLEQKVPKERFPEIHADLRSMGERTVTDILRLGEQAERELPVHVPYDPWGRRTDEIRVSSAWKELDRISAQEGLVAIGYERIHGEFSRIHQFAKLYLFHASSAMYTCPLAMTDGAARVLELHGNEELKSSIFSRLTSRNPDLFWTSGQWMTERTGGSDVSGTSTVACKKDSSYELHGVKWFTSATTSQMAMTLAKIDGDQSGKLSLFYVKLRDDAGNLRNIQVNRLKDKLGTKALPTAELTLKGCPAILIGEPGKGVKTIATLFNITRVYNAICALSYMRRALALSFDYATKRTAFGKPLIEHPLHRETINELQLKFEACFHLTFRAVELLGKEECGTASAEESASLRLLIPLAKLFTAKEAITITSEVLESFGGAGYIEDTGLPKLLRDSQVLSIWEGTTNVLALDCLRAIEKENAADAFLKEIEDRLARASLHHADLIIPVQKSLEKLKTTLSTSDRLQLEANARKIAFTLSRTYIASLLLDHADNPDGQQKAHAWITLNWSS